MQMMNGVREHVVIKPTHQPRHAQMDRDQLGPAFGVAIDVVLTLTKPDRVRAFGSILGASEGAPPEAPPVMSP